ncbi:uncharacterized protein LOC112493652 isoform X2 [Cephus cinctus]|uniref:Uncharacterized protein LOC112493652 isoform X2 n=1 Tax=Cephus cinctus TaxID=211228 RepID=A0AAJ7R7H9_CEPCN|nr:uncharacterized protein LOC112493652 isoform X2 [Cephus cinctus]
MKASPNHLAQFKEKKTEDVIFFGVTRSTASSFTPDVPDKFVVLQLHLTMYITRPLRRMHLIKDLIIYVSIHPVCWYYCAPIRTRPSGLI